MILQSEATSNILMLKSMGDSYVGSFELMDPFHPETYPLEKKVSNYRQRDIVSFPLILFWMTLVKAKLVISGTRTKACSTNMQSSTTNGRDHMRNFYPLLKPSTES